MEKKLEKSQTLTRLALCGALAVGLYAAAVKLPPLEPYRPWLEEHKMEAIAVAAAVLFGLSLLLLPLEREETPDGSPECDPCTGYERTEGPL